MEAILYHQSKFRNVLRELISETATVQSYLGVCPNTLECANHPGHEAQYEYSHGWMIMCTQSRKVPRAPKPPPVSWIPDPVPTLPNEQTFEAHKEVMAELLEETKYMCSFLENKYLPTSIRPAYDPNKFIYAYTYNPAYGWAVRNTGYTRKQSDWIYGDEGWRVLGSRCARKDKYAKPHSAFFIPKSK
jgi:hypothetical protein